VLPFIRILQPAPFPELLVKRYDDAMLEASERADQLLEAGDMAGAETWHRILNAIERLRAQKQQQ
jgi:hypothetical protein